MIPKTDPLCPVFGECGGCSYQDLPYNEELRVKQESLRRLLCETLRQDIAVEETVASPVPYHYRHRLDMTMKRFGPNLRMGFQSADSHKLIPVETCAIARKEISDFLPQLKTEAAAKFTEKYRVANLVVRTGQDGRVRWGGIGRRSLRMDPQDYLWTEVHGRRIFYSLETFFQANLFILPALMEKISQVISSVARDPGVSPPSGRRNDAVFFDLYSGVGLFGICFADKMEKVVMIEENTASTEIARYNAAYHGFQNVEVRSGKLETELPLALQNLPAGNRIAIVDPPRQGLSPEAVKALSDEKSFDLLFYLSCHPESLARDLAIFLKKGWKIQRVIPFDFFPRTKHLETLVAMKRLPDFDPRAIFGNSNPVEFEIGCGKGKFLMGMAAQNPDRNFFGIDRVAKWMRVGKERSEKRSLSNIQFAKAEAVEFLSTVPEKSIAVFHMYFPDPWPKRRHRSRRTIQDDFLRLLHSRLEEGGLIEIATDDEDYYRDIQKGVAATKELWKQIRETQNERIMGGDLKTNYELKFLAEGRVLYYLELRK